ncbi:MAG: helix-turn-helix domain-containing protein [Candidatus Micrarchaeota archaeon]
MYENTLTKIGLTINEVKVYEALIRMGQAPIEKIAARSGVHRRNIYDSIAKLLDRGLISELVVLGKKNYIPRDPSRLVDILTEKQNELGTILPSLQEEYRKVRENEEAYFYRGIEGFKNYLNDILEQKETVYFMGAKAFWLDPRLQYFLPKFDTERKKLGIKFMHIFDYEVKKKKPEILEFVGKPYKFLPKQYSSPTAVDIFGDYVVSFTGVEVGKLGDNPVQFVVKSRRLADGYKKFFRFMWDML